MIKKIIFTIFVVFFTTNIIAAELCGQEIHKKFGQTRTYVKHYLAICDSNNACYASTSKLGRVADTMGAVNDENAMRISRQDKDSPWLVSVNQIDVMKIGDIANGMDFVVDNNQPIRITPQLLHATQTPNEINIGAKLTHVLMKEFMPGNNVRWNYTTKYNDKESIFFSLIGLGQSLKWIGCMQNNGDGPF
jgi:hypothetical protein